MFPETKNQPLLFVIERKEVKELATASLRGQSLALASRVSAELAPTGVTVGLRQSSPLRDTFV